jgi:hypothetical protein
MLNASRRHTRILVVLACLMFASCAAFVGGGPHLTKEGNAEVAKAIAAYFVNHQ